MQLWLVHSDEVSLQDQIVMQMSLGILTCALQPGERLPSVRELARRFQVHGNTVSLAYRRLEREGWVQARRGSGVYVLSAPHNRQEEHAPEKLLLNLMAGVVDAGRRLGLADAEMLRLFAAKLESPGAGRIVVVEPELELRRIVVGEVEEAVGHEVEGCGFPLSEEDVATLGSGLSLVLPTKAARLRAALPEGARMQVLALQSVPEALAAFLPAPRSALVAICSHWPRFLELARMILIAAGFDGDALVMIDAREPGWKDAFSLAPINTVDAVVCDLVTETMLVGKVKVICFRLLSESTIATLRSATNKS